MSFNSLQTGRHICTGNMCTKATSSLCSVSIPFKREGIYALYGRNQSALKNRYKDLEGADRKAVSIPFKREGIYAQESTANSIRKEGKKTVSIPFKREGIYAQSQRESKSPAHSVSIPFKREGIYALSNRKRDRSGSRVSIPFKREGIYAR